MALHGQDAANGLSAQFRARASGGSGLLDSAGHSGCPIAENVEKKRRENMCEETSECWAKAQFQSL